MSRREELAKKLMPEDEFGQEFAGPLSAIPPEVWNLADRILPWVDQQADAARSDQEERIEGRVAAERERCLAVAHAILCERGSFLTPAMLAAAIRGEKP